MSQRVINYPTRWSCGKYRGSINDKGTSYLARINVNGKTINKYFTFSKFKSKEEAYQKAEEYCRQVSDANGLTRNMIRHLDKDTIEVQLTQGITMKCDAEDIDIVEKYPLQAKKNKRDNTYYCYYQDKKLAKQFSHLIASHNIVQFKNGNQLDLRKSNIKGFGEVEENKNYASDQYKYFNMKHKDLPHDIWLLGKPAGTIFKRTGQDIYNVRINDSDNKQRTTTFNISDYKSDKEAYEKTRQWQIETSYKLDVTRNLIRIIDNETIEVKLTKDQVMKTDRVFLPLIQKIFICITTSGSDQNPHPYANASINGVNKKYHGLITNFPLVDHINGDTLDNRLVNLRSASYSMNGINQHIECVGVRKTKTIHGNYYVSQLMYDNHCYQKSFSIDKHGDTKAKEMAIEMSKKLRDCIKFQKENVTINDEVVLIRFRLTFLKHAMQYIRQHTEFDINKYLGSIDIGENQKNEIHKHYISLQMKYYNHCKQEYDKVSQIYLQKTIR